MKYGGAYDGRFLFVSVVHPTKLAYCVANRILAGGDSTAIHGVPKVGMQAKVLHMYDDWCPSINVMPRALPKPLPH